MVLDNEIFIKCDCGTHIITLGEESEVFDNTNSVTDVPRFRQSFYMAMFEYGQYRQKPSIWQRLKFCVTYLRTGKMFTDQIIFEPEQAKNIIHFLTDNIEKYDRI